MTLNGLRLLLLVKIVGGGGVKNVLGSAGKEYEVDLESELGPAARAWSALRRLMAGGVRTCPSNLLPAASANLATLIGNRLVSICATFVQRLEQS